MKSLIVTVTKEKWDKAKIKIDEVLSCIENTAEMPPVNFKRLEVIRGYLCHMAMTYDVMSPFLKGLHLTLCRHLPTRDEQGWKLFDNAYLSYLRELIDQDKHSYNELKQPLNPLLFEEISIPVEVVPVDRVKNDFIFLRKMFAREESLEVMARSSNIVYLLYGFADASGTGFGSSVISRKGVRIRIGVWGKDEDEEETSNWREFKNSVEALEAEGKDGHSVEKVLFKVNSKSKNLCMLVMRVKELEVKFGCRILLHLFLELGCSTKGHQIKRNTQRLF